MHPLPPAVAGFLAGKRIAVAGVSRAGNQPANAIFRSFLDRGFEAVPINPHADHLEGVACYPDLTAVPGVVGGLMLVTHPAVAADLVRQAAARGIERVWFHRSFGEGSVSDAALQVCAEFGIGPIAGVCPLMYCEPVDLAHRCFRWWLGRDGRDPVKRRANVRRPRARCRCPIAVWARRRASSVPCRLLRGSIAIAPWAGL